MVARASSARSAVNDEPGRADISLGNSPLCETQQKNEHTKRWQICFHDSILKLVDSVSNHSYLPLTWASCFQLKIGYIATALVLPSHNWLIFLFLSYIHLYGWLWAEALLNWSSTNNPFMIPLVSLVFVSCYQACDKMTNSAMYNCSFRSFVSLCCYQACD